MSAKTKTLPNRNEIWLVELDPTTGEELKKTRPVLVVSVSYCIRDGLRVIVPLCSWKDHYEDKPWMIPLKKKRFPFLQADMAADPTQIRSVSVERFKHIIGRSSPKIIDEIVAGVAMVIGYE